MVWGAPPSMCSSPGSAVLGAGSCRQVLRTGVLSYPGLEPVRMIWRVVTAVPASQGLSRHSVPRAKGGTHEYV